MTDICIANFASVEDVDAERDDPSFDLSSMSSPQFHSATASPTQKWIDDLKQAALDEWAYVIESEGLEDLVIWGDSGWITPEEGRTHRTIFANLEDGFVFGCITIQKEVLV